MERGPPSKLRVAHVGRYRPDSLKGVDILVASLVEELAAGGVQPEIWHFSDQAAKVVRESYPWGDEYTIPSHTGFLASALRLPRVSEEFLASSIHRVDAVHLHSVFVPEHGLLSRIGLPVVVSPHGGYRTNIRRGRRRWRKSFWIKLFERPHLQRANRVLVNSEVEAAELTGLVDEGRIELVPGAIPDVLLDEEVPLPSQGSDWLFLGRLDVITKGLDILIGAYAGIQRTPGLSVPNLVIAGPDHRGSHEFLVRTIEKRGLADRVRLPGPISAADKVALVGSCRLFILPSRNEGMPLSVMEALALGRPVVVTPGTNLGTLVRASNSGWVAESDVASLEERLRDVAQATDEYLDRVGRNARETARSSFRWPVVIAGLAEIYRSAVSEGPIDSRTRRSVAES
jgi:glycosyltransferase involved in cell wall biosynthesis